jgi:hypothetical protein
MREAIFYCVISGFANLNEDVFQYTCIEIPWKCDMNLYNLFILFHYLWKTYPVNKKAHWINIILIFSSKL